MDVVGGGEQDADEVVLVDVVALEHLDHQGLDPLVDLLVGVGVDGGRAARSARTAGDIDGNLVRWRPARRRLRPGARTSAWVSGRHSPGFRRRSAIGPMRVRTRRAHGMTDRLAHPPHLAVAALVDGELDRPRRHERRRCAGAVTPSSSSTPSRRRRSAAGEGRALDLGEVLLLHAERRMGQAVGEIAVVGEHAAGPRCRRRGDRRGRPAARAAPGRPPSGDPGGRGAVVTTPLRLVQQVVDETRRASTRGCRRPRPGRARRRPADPGRPPRRSRSPGRPRSASRTCAGCRSRARASTFCRRSPRRTRSSLVASCAAPAPAPRRPRGRARTRPAAADRRASRGRAARGTADWCRRARPGRARDREPTSST